MGLGIIACNKKEVLPNNPESTSNVKADILDIFNSVRKGNSSLKNLADFNIKNLDNPLDSVGFLHNKVLIFIINSFPPFFKISKAHSFPNPL